jgi:hypothetical protein
MIRHFVHSHLSLAVLQQPFLSRSRILPLRTNADCDVRRRANGAMPTLTGPWLSCGNDGFGCLLSTNFSAFLVQHMACTALSLRFGYLFTEPLKDSAFQDQR